MQSKPFLFALHASLLCAFIGWSTVASAQEAGSVAGNKVEAPEGPAPSPSKSPVGSKIAAPEVGKGQIVFFREKKFAGAGVRYKVREGSTELGKLSSGTYFVEAVEPGTHQYTVHSEAKDVLTLEVEAGETYYVQGGVTMGVFAGHPNLSPSDQTVFDGMSAKLKSTD